MSPSLEIVLCMATAPSTSCSPLQLGDMSLSDNASMCLMSVIRRLAALRVAEKDYRELVQRALLERLRKALRSPTEVRGQSAALHSRCFDLLSLFCAVGRQPGDFTQLKYLSVPVTS